MSRLINPGVGDITDRLTILALKILHGQERGADLSHWERERATLLGLIRARTLNGIWFESVLELAAVNARIWETEDGIREWREQEPEGVKGPEAVEVARLVFRNQSLNDRRAELVHAINEAAGDDRGQEKQR